MISPGVRRVSAGDAGVVVFTWLLAAALIGMGSESILWLMGGHPLIREMVLD